jgi:hypothetical protein
VLYIHGYTIIRSRPKRPLKLGREGSKKFSASAFIYATVFKKEREKKERTRVRERE